MVSEELYLDNLRLASRVVNVPGDIVECGVWRGGMVAGIAELLGSHRRYWLFDSFEGLPAAREIDGIAAIEWQNNPKGEFYYENCRAEQRYAQQAMQMATSGPVEIIAGWFENTVGSANLAKIALLRLDGDW